MLDKNELDLLVNLMYIFIIISSTFVLKEIINYYKK